MSLFHFYDQFVFMLFYQRSVCVFTSIKYLFGYLFYFLSKMKLILYFFDFVLGSIRGVLSLDTKDPNQISTQTHRWCKLKE